MKLVEILAAELAEWPKDATCITQDDGGAVNGASDKLPPVLHGNAWGGGAFYLDDPDNQDFVMTLTQADDYGTAIVTRAQWQAERDRQKGGEWKRHRGGKCPVSGNTQVEVKFRDGDIRQSHASDFFGWKHGELDDKAAEVMQYRIISQPQAEEPMKARFDGCKLEFSRDGVNFSEIGTARVQNICDLGSSEAQWHQIDGPIKWRDTIIHCQAIIEDCEREIERNVQLLDAEGLMMQTDSKRAMQHYAQDVDMGDWRNWQAGDIVECVTSEYEGTYDNGKQYIVEWVNDEMFSVYDNYGGNSSCDWFDHDAEGLKFIRRP